MGYVNESYSSPIEHLDVLANGSKIRTFASSSSTEKSQYGYRSGPLSKEERAAVDRFNSRTGLKWKDNRSIMAAFDKMQRATTPNPAVDNIPFVVNDREYEEWKRPVHTIHGYREHSGHKTFKGYAQMWLNISSAIGPINRSEHEFQATRLMRTMRPTKPDFELARFVGELRDAPKMAFLRNYQPKQLADLGAGYLNFQFGLRPTGSDIQKAAEAVVNSDTILRNFASHALASVRRSNTRTVLQDVRTGSGSFGSGKSSTVRTIGDIRILSDLGGNLTTDNGLQVAYTLDRKRSLRAFATFEYYIGDPNGFSTRIDSYMAGAKKILGGGLNASTAWQLTPWTWMIDWYTDISNLLAYQQDVADNGLVARRAGFVVEDTYSILGSVSNTIQVSNNTFVNNENTTLAGTCKFQKRFSGSPYSMSLNWEMSGFQWAIAGALGLTKANKVPFLRIK